MKAASERLNVGGLWNQGGSRQPGQRERGSIPSSRFTTMRGTTGHPLVFETFCHDK